MQAVLASRGAAGIRLGLELGRGRQHGFGQPQGAGPLRRGGISDEDEQAAEDTLTPWMCQVSIDQHLQRACAARCSGQSLITAANGLDRGRGGRGRGDRGGRGGRGRGRGRGGRGKEEKEWIPVTKLGRLVKDGKIKSLEEIYLFSLPIKVSLCVVR